MIYSEVEISMIGLIWLEDKPLNRNVRKKIGMQLLVINCKVTSSDADLPTFPNMVLAEQ